MALFLHMRKDEVKAMLDNYEKFKADVFRLTKIDLNCYKEKQMRRRIDTLVSKNSAKTYDEYIEIIKNDKEKFGLYTNLLYNQALLIEGLSVGDPLEFTNDICKIMK